jgi:hypothetical protein
LLVRALFIFLLLLAPIQPAPTPSRSDAPFPEARGTLDSAAATLRRELAGLTSPELERRRAYRRIIQQRGYAFVLHSILAGDGFGALLEFARLNAQLEFHVPRNTLFVYARVHQPEITGWRQTLPGTSGAPSAPIAIPLVDDTSFPKDPWSKAR